MGGVVWGIGMALHEETVMDHRFGRIMNHNIAEYHIPVNADIHNIEVIFVEERDDRINRLGVKGIGEIGIGGSPRRLRTPSITPPVSASAASRSRWTSSSPAASGFYRVLGAGIELPARTVSADPPDGQRLSRQSEDRLRIEPEI